MGFVKILEAFGQIGKVGESFQVEELALMIRATRGRSRSTNQILR